MTDSEIEAYLKDHRVDPSLHTVRAKLMSHAALSVTRALKGAGFRSFLVGGCIRDIFMGKEPKDFDVATDATPEQVKAVFRNRQARIIGRRFRIVHVVFNIPGRSRDRRRGAPRQEIIEVTTFRGGAGEEAEAGTDRVVGRAGMLVRANTFGTIATDVLRRDFTINSLYFDPEGGILYDFLGGIGDLRERRIDIIGEPDVRYREDPVRMLRAVRFAAKLDMIMTSRTSDPMHDYAGLLEGVSNARMYDEMKKMLLTGNAERTYALMEKQELAQHVFPGLEAALEDRKDGAAFRRFITLVFRGTDQRIRSGKAPNERFLFACLLWPEFMIAVRGSLGSGDPGAWRRLITSKGLRSATDSVLRRQAAHTMYPHFVVDDIAGIWRLMARMQTVTSLGDPLLDKICDDDSFMHLYKACCDFLHYRSEAGESEQVRKACDLWFRILVDRDLEMPGQTGNSMKNAATVRAEESQDRQKPASASASETEAGDSAPASPDGAGAQEIRESASEPGCQHGERDEDDASGKSVRKKAALRRDVAAAAGEWPFQDQPENGAGAVQSQEQAEYSAGPVRSREQMEDSAGDESQILSSRPVMDPDFTLVPGGSGRFPDGLKGGTVDLAADPREAFQEDPLRILRIIRMAVAFDARIMPRSADPVYTMGALLDSVPPRDRFQEVRNLLLCGHSRRCLEYLLKFNLLRYLFPELDRIINAGDGLKRVRFIGYALQVADADLQGSRDLRRAERLIFAALLWPVMQEKIVNISGENWIQEPPPAPEWRLIAGAAADLLERQCASLLLPQDLKTTMCSVWLLMLDMSGTSAAPQTQWEVYNSEFFQTGCQLLTLRARFDPRLAFAVEYWEQVRDRLAGSSSGQAAGAADMAEFEALPEDQVSGESDGNSVTAAQPLSDGEYSNDESFF